MGKGGDAAASRRKAPGAVTEQAAQEVLIDGKLYDVRDFKHPGGSIVKFLTGNGDASDAFREFHGRSKKANKVLESLPKRDAPADLPVERVDNGKSALARDFEAMRQQLVADGFFEPSPREVFGRVTELVLMHALGAWMFMANECWCTKAAGIAVLGLASGRCGWLMHEGGHYSLTGHIPTDRALQVVMYGVGCGMSGMWWRNQHNKHHATPQKLKHDVDLDTLPLVAFNAAVVDKVKSPVMRTWLKFQSYLFIPVSCLLVALGWQYYLHPRHILRTLTSKRAPKGYNAQARHEAAALVTRHALLAALFAGYSYPQSVGLYMAYNFVAASYIFTNFALSHTHLPVTKPDEYLHWVEYASNHTTNLAPNPICNWWMAYLNFQIEHHLFPSMPQFRHPETSKRVQELFAKHGLHYDQRPYFSCLWQTLGNLNSVGAELSGAKPKAA